jgi:hypothetical protein
MILVYQQNAKVALSPISFSRTKRFYLWWTVQSTRHIVRNVVLRSTYLIISCDMVSNHQHPEVHWVRMHRNTLHALRHSSFVKGPSLPCPWNQFIETIYWWKFVVKQLKERKTLAFLRILPFDSVISWREGLKGPLQYHVCSEVFHKSCVWVLIPAH